MSRSTSLFAATIWELQLLGIRRNVPRFWRGEEESGEKARRVAVVEGGKEEGVGEEGAVVGEVGGTKALVVVSDGEEEEDSFGGL